MSVDNPETVTIKTVLEAFKSKTSQDWYPDPSSFSQVFIKDCTVGEAVDRVDEIIAQHAIDQGITFADAQNDTKTPLSDDARQLYAEFVAWADAS